MESPIIVKCVVCDKLFEDNDNLPCCSKECDRKLEESVINSSHPSD